MTGRKTKMECLSKHPFLRINIYLRVTEKYAENTTLRPPTPLRDQQTGR